MKNQNISSYVNVLLRKCPPTSVDIERFFSQLGKLLQKDPNFNTENIEKYICVLYNSKKLQKSLLLSVTSQRHRLLGPTVNRPGYYISASLSMDGVFHV